MLAREEASFSVGRESSVGRIKRVRLEDSIGSEQNRMTCKTGKTQFIRQSDAIPKLKAIWAFFSRYIPLWLSWYRIRLQCWRPRFNPELGRSPGEGKDYPLQYPDLENSGTV